MKWLSKKEIEKYEWLHGYREDIIPFRGMLQDEMSLFDGLIRDILTELNIKENRFIGKNIKKLINQINKNPKLKEFQHKKELSNELNKINKIRIYAAHGISWISGKGTILMLEEDKSKALFFDEELINEVKEISGNCLRWLSEIDYVLHPEDF